MSVASQTIIFIMIILGALLMQWNIIRYALFLNGMGDVISAGDKKSTALRATGLVLLIFFFLGYLFTALFGSPDYMMGGILFGGSVFVWIVLNIMFNLTDVVKNRTLEISEMLIGMIEARDPNLCGHSLYVRNLTMLIYKHLPFSIKYKINPVSIEYAALMHDVGKLAVPESILNKPSGLDEGEWRIMKKHPLAGVKMLSPIKSFETIVPWIKFHHERIDGGGYYGLKGKEIPLEARIICVADSYSAITMKRAYKDAKTYEEAAAILRDCAGSQFDAQVVDIFLSIPKKEVEACVPKTVEA
ncbi:MAG: HD domain-containing protein [Treponema sp.]|nr:HD domain-containing protein [Treponema sp.]